MPLPFSRGDKASAPSTPKGDQGGNLSLSEASSPAFSKELNRLRNELAVKAKALEQADREVTTLKVAIGTKDKALQKSSDECERLNNLQLKSEEGRKAALNRIKELEHEHIKLQSQSSDAQRQADKLQQKLNGLVSINQDATQGKVASLLAEVKTLTSELGKVKEDNKTCYSMIRSKDKELDKALTRAKEAEALSAKLKEMDNGNADMQRQLKEAKHEVHTLEALVRHKDAEVLAVNRKVDETAAVVAANTAVLDKAKAEVQVLQDKLNSTETELSLNKAELIRVKKVATRVAVSEHLAGAKEGGTVPITRHLEEVHFLQGHIEQLKAKLQLTEASVETMRAYQDKYHQLISPAKEVNNGSATPNAGKTPTPVRTSSVGKGSSATKSKATPRAITPKSSSSFAGKLKDAATTPRPKAGATPHRNKDSTPRAKADRLTMEDSVASMT